jgi:transcriptional regulator with PAS, ATPase and Fis domain
LSNPKASSSDIEFPPAKIYKPTASFPVKEPDFFDHADTYDDITDSELIQTESSGLPETLSLQEKEKEMIRAALVKHKGKRKPAALELGISERTLYRKIKEYGLEEL